MERRDCKSSPKPDRIILFKTYSEGRSFIFGPNIPKHCRNRRNNRKTRQQWQGG